MQFRFLINKNIKKKHKNLAGITNVSFASLIGFKRDRHLNIQHEPKLI